jgi:hypothetical protein
MVLVVAYPEQEDQAEEGRTQDEQAGDHGLSYV